jgi:putative nucleotidyltransferase with HDIG domain
LAHVPILEEEQAKAYLRLLARFAELIGGMVLAARRQEEGMERQRQAEIELRNSEARYRSLFEDSPVAMWEEDHSAVKTCLEGLVAGGVEDVSAYLQDHPEVYDHCVDLARTLNVNQAAVDLYKAGSREQLVERAGEVDLSVRERSITHFWAAMLSGRRMATVEDSVLTLRGQRIEVRETFVAAPGHEDTFDRVYIADLDVTDQARAERHLRRTLEQLRRSVDATVGTLMCTIELRDPYTAGHQERVSRLAQAIGERLGLGKRRLTALRVAASIHDLGKMSVPAEILSKPGVLNEAEMLLIRQHPSVAFEILREVRFQGPVAEIVRAHHERLDGSGYPRGLTGDEIRLESRILAVADVVEAMSAHRPYRPALGIDAALTEVSSQRGVLYDAGAADACVGLFRDGGFAFS